MTHNNMTTIIEFHRPKPGDIMTIKGDFSHEDLQWLAKLPSMQGVSIIWLNPEHEVSILSDSELEEMGLMRKTEAILT